MTIDEILSQAVDDLFDHAGPDAVTATYHDGTTEVDITVIKSQEEPAKMNAEKAMTITAKRSDVAEPGYRHTFTIDGVVWHVAMEDSRPQISGDSHLWTIGLVSGERSKAWRT